MMEMPYQNNITDLLENKLCDFQRCTVDYIYQQMEEKGQKRMLVADEVGLGKTWIAKGVIAKAFQHWYEQNKPAYGKSFNVFYICSNLQLASQNLGKLNFGKNDCVTNITRITELAIDKETNNNEAFKIYSLTPETSFKESRRTGTKTERAIIYNLLGKLHQTYEYRLKDLLDIGSCGKIKNKIQDQYEVELNKEISEYDLPKTFSKLRAKGMIDNSESFLEIIMAVCDLNTKELDKKIKAEIIGALRKTLIQVCIKYMEASYFIMDEFQRYKDLIDFKEGDDEQKTIAQEIFSDKDAKVLMLSATPFKAYTNEADEVAGEMHYAEFKKVLKFLYQNQPIDWTTFEDKRSSLYSSMLKLKTADQTGRQQLLAKINSDKSYLERIYVQVMVRTEKLIASKDANGMTPEREPDYLNVSADDIKDFTTLDKVFQKVYEKQGENAPVPIDYAKSAPYAMSFLRDYKIGRLSKGKESALAEILDKGAFLPLEGNESISDYGFMNTDGNKKWPSAKLQLLMEGIEKNSLLLWCPPSMPYYKMEGPFKGMESFTKTLIFSAWKLVPKMISSLVSYKAECETISKVIEDARYFAKETSNGNDDDDTQEDVKDIKIKRRPFRRLMFRTEKGNMTTLLLAYPSKALADLYDPLSNIWEKKSISQILRTFRSRNRSTYKEYGEEISQPGVQTTMAYWAFPILLDKKKKNIGTEWIDDYMHDQKMSKKKKGHLQKLKDYINQSDDSWTLPSLLNNGRDIVRFADTMTYLALGSPAICAYRSLRRYRTYFKWDKEKRDNEKENKENNLLTCAMRIGFAFIDFFNKPESIAVIDCTIDSNVKTNEESKKMEYWNKVLRYCAYGNLQAVLDEYIFLLINDYKTPDEIATAIENVLGIRTASLRVDDKNSFCKSDIEDEQHPRNMRTHYAVPFGIQLRIDDKTVQRSSDVRNAFNSPFRPFVLTTTSIGQEGLDFHYYCRRIMHWNLPNNPIDFEQREGRINRYRGQVIRQRIVAKYKDELNDTEDAWTDLFEKAKQEKNNAKLVCDIVPNWHVDTEDKDQVGIERIVPLYKFSKDILKYNQMKKVLGNYRLTFGQPRQEELVEALDCNLTDEEKEELLINLSPIKRGNTEE